MHVYIYISVLFGHVVGLVVQSACFGYVRRNARNVIDYVSDDIFHIF